MEYSNFNVKYYFLFLLCLFFSFEAISQTDRTYKLTTEEVYFLNGVQAIMYRNDFNESLEWLSKSIKLGYVPAIHYLVDMYYEGRHTSKNYDEAVYWLQKGAKADDLRSMYFLGLIYSDKDYQKKSEKEAIKWFKKSSKKGYLLSNDALEFIKIDKNKQEALIRKLLEEANANNTNSMLELGKLYLTSSEHKDFKKGVFWIEKSAKSNSIGMYYSGFLYGEGIGVKQDYYVAVMMTKNSLFYGYEKAYGLFIHYKDKKTAFEQRMFLDRN
jgi:TPR repeat protein